MCDAFIPQDALAPDVERELLSRVTDILVDHELRRVTDLARRRVEARAILEAAGLQAPVGA